MGIILWGHLSGNHCNSLEKLCGNVVLCTSVKDCAEWNSRSTVKGTTTE